jgi:hypothetical protein
MRAVPKGDGDAEVNRLALNGPPLFPHGIEFWNFP